jgi:hypothetical protein
MGTHLAASLKSAKGKYDSASFNPGSKRRLDGVRFFLPLPFVRQRQHAETQTYIPVRDARGVLVHNLFVPAEVL